MNDTIYRQAAIDAICRECQGTFLPCESFPCDEIEALKDLPSVQTEKTLLTVKCELDDEELRRAIENVKNAKLELIAAQQEQQWIPVTERLPEEDLFTGGGKQFSNSVLMTVYDKNDEDTIVDYGHTTDGEWYSDTADEFIESIADWKVIAWMPLPEPYKEEEE